MSYSHCEKHDRDSTNGCLLCAYEEREAPFSFCPRPWTKGIENKCLVVDALNVIRARVGLEPVADVILAAVNDGYTPRPQ